MDKLFFTMLLILSATFLFSDESIVGFWQTGKNNTVVEIYEKDGLFFGKVIKSKKVGASIGKDLITNCRLIDGKYYGELNNLKSNETFNIILSTKEEDIEIAVLLGFFKQKKIWSRHVEE